MTGKIIRDLFLLKLGNSPSAFSFPAEDVIFLRGPFEGLFGECVIKHAKICQDKKI
jgi:hypothetical protein